MLAALLVTLACGQELREGASAERPSIVLVTIDTLRREHLGCYGYERPTSPRVDALAAESVLFERAFAPMAQTYPSHLSMLTGLYPHEHGRATNGEGVRNPFVSGGAQASIAAELRSAGYRTAGFVSSIVLHEGTGIGAGFDVYDVPAVRFRERTSRETMDRVLAWLAGVPAGEPFFLWVHLWDPHEPNRPTPEFAALLAPDDALRAFVSGRRLDPAALAQRYGGQQVIGENFFAFRPPTRSRAALRTSGVQRDAKGGFRIDTESLVALHARYDACVRQVDTAVGRLIDALVQRGSWPRTAFVFTADHGQSLGDGGNLGHNLDTQVNVRVPLVIHFPAGSVPQPARSDALVSLVDLMPTLLAALPIGGLERYLAQCTGRDVLSPDFAREGVITAETRKEYAIVTGRWKYARVMDVPAGQLFDLEGAGEARDVAAENEAIARELDRLLARALESTVGTVEPSGKVDPATQELLDQLEELGYGGGADEDDR
jgi:arylsulfatase